ncbi:MAG: site-specific integrase [Synechococcaceae cyanobacterium SM2_3_1]|nr:site-specific integrase [Synechococcaceae cyanobacterium SM2_3_1]
MAQSAFTGKERVGRVTLERYRDTLRLRWTVDGKRYSLTVGKYSRDVLQAARAKAKQIDADIAWGRFDPILASYSKQTATILQLAGDTNSDTNPDLAALWQQYEAHKISSGASPSTVAKDYGKTRRLINRLPACTLKDAPAIRDYLVTNHSPNAAKRYMTQINACVNWAMISGIVSHNPFALLKKTITQPKAKRKTGDVIKAFTSVERDRILDWFKESKPYSHYYNYVYFLFYTGCRPSEAIALRWGDITDPHVQFRRVVIISEDGLVSKEGLKTQEGRDFPMNESLRRFMQSIRPIKTSTDGLVFASPRDRWIDHHNFQTRAWKDMLAELPDLPRLSSYHTRHTFITLCIDAGVHEKDVKRWCGNSAGIILAAYASAKRDLTVPEL